MNDEKANDAELTELESLPELPEDALLAVEELGPPDGGAPAPSSDTAGDTAGGTDGEPAAPDRPPATAGLDGGEKPPLRELDKAPFHLRRAALIVVVGCLLPWMGHGGGWITSGLGKLLVLLAAWLWLQQIDHNWGPKLGGLLGRLGELELRPRKEEKKVRRSRPGTDQRPTVLSHPFPTGLHVLSLGVLAVACIGLPKIEGLGGLGFGKAMTELGILAWAAFTWIHIYSYERWSHFNPIFPLMFLAMLFGGALQAISVLTADVGGLVKLSSVAGGGLVGFGGGLAAYTIVEALRAAKKEGDAKKAAAIEARRAARQQASGRK